MSRFDPAVPFADFLRKRRTTIPISQSRDFDNSNVEAGSTVDGIAAQAANQSADQAIRQLRKAGGHSNWVFELQAALGTILRFSDPRCETWDLPDTRRTHDLLGSVYEALGNAIRWGTSDHYMGRIEIEHLTEGLLAAARLIEAFDQETFTARHDDDRTRVKVLIHRARIAEHYQDLERRRRDRERGTFGQILGKAAEDADIFG